MYNSGFATCLAQKVFVGPNAMPSLKTALVITPGKLIRCAVKFVPFVVVNRKMLVPVPFSDEVPRMICVFVPAPRTSIVCPIRSPLVPKAEAIMFEYATMGGAVKAGSLVSAVGQR